MRPRNVRSTARKSSTREIGKLEFGDGEWNASRAAGMGAAYSGIDTGVATYSGIVWLHPMTNMAPATAITCISMALSFPLGPPQWTTRPTVRRMQWSHQCLGHFIDKVNP